MTVLTNRLRSSGLLMTAAMIALVNVQPSFAQDDGRRSDDSRRPDEINVADADAAGATVDGHSIAYWIEQLASDSYSRRQRATSVLTDAGVDVIKPLVEATRDGDFEVVSRTMQILQVAAGKQGIDDTGGAVGLLREMADTGIGARGLAARQVLASLEKERDAQAQKRLAEAGVFIGQSQFKANFNDVDFLVRIDDRWSGDIEAIKWVRWLRGFDTIVLADSGCIDPVLQQICELRSLQRIQLNNGKLSREGLDSLKKLKQIRVLEFNYVALDGKPENVISTLALSTELTMRGCKLSNDQTDRIRKALPAISIEITRGAFLGVLGSNVGQGKCLIGSVIPGGAAAKAGLKANDIIIDLNGKPISNFFDLKAVVSQQKPSTPLKMKVDRFVDGQMKTLTLTATLQKVNLPK